MQQPEDDPPPHRSDDAALIEDGKIPTQRRLRAGYVALACSSLPIALLYLCLLWPMMEDRPPELSAPSSRDMPGIDGVPVLIETFEGAVGTFAWYVGLGLLFLFSLLFVVVVMLTSFFAAGAVAGAVYRYRRRISWFDMLFTGFGISIVWIGVVVALFRPFDP